MPRWRRVDIYEKDISASVINDNLFIINNIEKKGLVSLADCVDDAIGSGNHVAFALEFIKTFEEFRKYNLSYNELMSRAYYKAEEFIDRKTADATSHGLRPDEKKIVEMHTKLQAPYYVKDTAWRSPGCVYNLNGSADEEKRKEVYSESGRKKWKKKSRIKRDVLVQHALVMGLDADETDEMLMKAGYSSLYPLDVVDACAIINLNKYAGRMDISPYEVLRNVKSDINSILCRLQGPSFLFVGKGTEAADHKGILTYAAGRHVDTDLQNLRTLLEQNDPKYSETLTSSSGLTRFLTEYFNEKIRNTSDASGYFNDSGIEANIIFTQRYYGFLRKTKEYLYDWERYCKNLELCTWTLTPVFGFHDFVSDKRGKSTSTSYGGDVRTVLDRLREAEPDTDEYYEDCLRLIQYVRTFDFLYQSNDFTRFDPDKNDWFTYGRIMIEGEKIKYTQTDSETLGKKKRETGYEFHMAKKKDVVRFALSAGREEEIGEYLMLARYWKKNWYREIAGGKSMSVCEEEHFYPDAIDKLLIYALLYRDSLIKKWCQKKKEPNGSKE